MCMQTLKMNDGFAFSDRTWTCLQESSLNTDGEKERLAGAARALRAADTEETQRWCLCFAHSHNRERDGTNTPTQCARDNEDKQLNKSHIQWFVLYSVHTKLGHFETTIAKNAYKLSEDTDYKMTRTF